LNEDQLRSLFFFVNHFVDKNLLWFHSLLQCEAFRRGLRSIIPLHWFQMFSPEEIQLLISGSEEAIDVDDMQANTVYGHGYTPDTPAIKHFWSVVRSMNTEERRLLLRFITSTDRAPLLGFAHLHPRLCIQKVCVDILFIYFLHLRLWCDHFSRPLLTECVWRCCGSGRHVVANNINLHEFVETTRVRYTGAIATEAASGHHPCPRF
jgi:hypothetical protein